MDHSAELQVTPRTTRLAGAGFARARAAVGRALRLASARLRRYRHARTTRDELRSLDDRMLHDLGLHRSEIGSVAAEVAGIAECTRLLVLRGPRLSDDFCLARWTGLYPASPIQ